MIRTLIISLIFLLSASLAFAAIGEDYVTVVWDAGGSSAATNGGGASKVAWDAGSPSDFMTVATGAALVSVDAVAVTTSGGGAALNINHAATTTVTNDTIAYFDFAATYDDGYYLVTYVDDENVTIAVAYSENTTCDIDIGGAIDGLASLITNAADLADASSVNCDIFIKGNETTAAVTVAAGGGTTTTRLSFIGVDTDWEPIALTATSGWPEITNTGLVRFQDVNILVRGLKFISNVVGAGVQIDGKGGGLLSCHIKNSNVGGIALTLSSCYAANCYIESAGTNAALAAVELTRASLMGSTVKVTGTCNGIDIANGFASANVIDCIVHSTGSGTYGIWIDALDTSGSPTLLGNNTIDDWTDCIHLDEMFDLGDNGSLVIANNILSDYDSYGIDKTAAGTQGIMIINNAFWDAQTTGVTVNAIPQLLSITLTGDPYTTQGTDYSLDNTAGEGAACRAAGFPGARTDGNNTGYGDVGADQHEDAGVGGGGGVVGVSWN